MTSIPSHRVRYCALILFVLLTRRTPPDEAGGGTAATGAPEAEGGGRSVAWLWNTHALALDSDDEGFRRVASRRCGVFLKYLMCCVYMCMCLLCICVYVCVPVVLYLSPRYFLPLYLICAGRSSCRTVIAFFQRNYLLNSPRFPPAQIRGEHPSHYCQRFV